MKNGYTRELMRRLASLLLAVVVAVTFMPFLGEGAYAEDLDGEAAASAQSVQAVSEEKADAVITDEELADMEKQIEESLDLEDEEENANTGISATEVLDNTVAEDASTDDSDEATAGSAGEGNLVSQDMSLFDDGKQLSAEATNYRPGINYFSGTVSQSGNIVTVTCEITDKEKRFRFDGLYVDGYGYGTEMLINGKSVTGTSVKATIDMSKFATGYHSVMLYVATAKNCSYTNTDGITLKDVPANTSVDVIGSTYLYSNTITATPTYAGRREVYSNYLNIYPYNMYNANEAEPLYMEFSSDGGKNWGNRYKLRDANLIELKIQQGSMVGGLSPNTTYQTRLRYGIYVTYDTVKGGDGKDYLFLGPALNTGAIKTGKAKKPKIKSVTCKAVKVKYHKVRWPGYWNVVGGVAFWHKPYTERYYTYKVKVTIKLKKKPGTAGIWVSCSDSSGEKFLKGNKKKYTTTFTPLINYSSKRPKGHVKVKVTVRSGQSKTYGGYSPLYTSKKKKLK